MKVFVGVAESFNHQTQFVTLVSPIAWEAFLADVVRCETTNLGFGDFQRTLVVNVLVVSRAQVVDDGHGLSHEVHHVLGIGAHHVVFSKELTDAHSKNQAGVEYGVLVSKDGADFGGGKSGFCKVKNE